jgi:hypothetical protein
VSRQVNPRSIGATLALVVLAASYATTPASAQDGDPGLGERVWREIANCGDCHGWAGDGVPDIAQRSGANLRDSFLTPELAEFAIETIRCGRPGTQMPSFRRNTWTDIIPCYGMNEPMEGGLQPARADSPLSDRFIEALVAFIFRDFIGAGPVTREYCQTVFSVNSQRCTAYPTEVELAPPEGPSAPANDTPPAPSAGH